MPQKQNPTPLLPNRSRVSGQLRGGSRALQARGAGYCPRGFEGPAQRAGQGGAAPGPGGGSGQSPRLILPPLGGLIFKYID